MPESAEAPEGKPLSTIVRTAVILAVAAAFAAALYLRPDRTAAENGAGLSSQIEAAQGKPAEEELPTSTLGRATPNRPAASLPRVVEFGRDQCLACRMMKPVFEELALEYQDKLVVESVDVGIAPELARAYRVQLIPLQVFLDAAGNEIFRHEGFYSKADIVAKWKELGFDLDAEAGREE